MTDQLTLVANTDLSEVIAEASHERAATERLAESAARIGRGEETVSHAWLTETIAGLRETLAARHALAELVEGIPELVEVAQLHRDIRRLLGTAIADLQTAMHSNSDGAAWIEGFNDSGVIRGDPCPVWPDLFCIAPGSDLSPCASYRSHMTSGKETRVLCESAVFSPPDDEDQAA